MSVETKHKALHKDSVGFIPSPLASAEDKALWADFKDGSRASFALIYKNYFFSLYRYGLKRGYAREVVKDSIQDLFVELWKYRQNLKDTDKIEFYLLKSLRNKLSKQVSPVKDGGTSPGLLPDDIGPGDLSIEDKLIEEQTLLQHKKNVLQAIDLLSQRQQEAIRLKYFQNLKNEEIAEHMAISVPSVYNLVSKAIKTLRKQLGKAFVLLLFCLFS